MPSKEEVEKVQLFLDKNMFLGNYAFCQIIKHLESKKNDPRKKERLRVKLALDTIDKWFRQGEKVYVGLGKGNQRVPKEAAKKLVQSKRLLHKKRTGISKRPRI